MKNSEEAVMAEGQRRFQQRIGESSRHLLELLSRGGDVNEHSPCPFCQNQGQCACTNEAAKKLGPCERFALRNEEAESLERQIIHLANADVRAQWDNSLRAAA